MKKIVDFLRPTWRKIFLVVVLAALTFVGLSETILNHTSWFNSEPSQAATLLNVKDYGAKGDGVNDDGYAIEKCLNASAATQSVCYIPAGRYAATSMTVPSNSSVKGDGETSVIIENSGDNSGRMFWTTNASNVSFSDLRLEGWDTGTMKSDVGILMGNSSNITIQRLTFNNLAFAVRTGNDSKQSQNINITDSRALSGNHTFLFAAYTSGLILSGCDIDSYTGDPGGTSHHLYLAANVNDLTINNSTFRHGSNYSIQIYPGPDLSNIIFNNISMIDVFAGMITQSATAITVNGMTAASNRYASGGSWFSLSDSSSVLVENFSISGATSLVSASASTATFRNGAYSGSNLGSNSGITYENVLPNTIVIPTSTSTSTTTTAISTTLPTTTTSSTTSTSITTTTRPVTTSTMTTTTRPATTTTTIQSTTTTKQKWYQRWFGRKTTTTAPYYSATTTTTKPSSHWYNKIAPWNWF